MKAPHLIAVLTLACYSARAEALRIFKEDFAGGLEENWSASEGSWEVRDGVATAEGKFCQLLQKALVIADVDITADVAVVHDEPHASAGIQVRLADDGTGYAIGLREVDRGVHPEHGPWERPVIQLFRMEPGGWKLLQEAKVMDYRPGELRKIRVLCKGPDLFVFYQDMETPVLREYDDSPVAAGKVALFKDQTGSGLFDNVTIQPAGKTPVPSLRTDWSWVRGAIYVRSDAVNSVEMWHDYWDHTTTVDRELSYAATYGFNMVQVYLHWIVWDRHGEEYLKRIDDFLARSAKHGLKVNLIFWDDCGHVEPSLDFAPPIPGRHNSQMMPNPSHKIRDSRELLDAHREKFRDYVSSIAGRFKADDRISFWQLYNEAMGARDTYRVSETDKNIDTLLSWTREWVKETGSQIPVTATYGGFQGAKYSDFPTYHSYSGDGNALPNADGGPEHLCTETLNRPHSDMKKIISEIGGKKNGFIVWELMIGRDNCRYPWGHPDGLDEPSVPFHGVIYPDGHPWQVAEVQALMGEQKMNETGFFQVSYHEGKFGKLVKESITPLIDFDLGDEPGTGSPDASAGIPKDDFSIRWTGNFSAPEDGKFSFHIATDGHAEMLVGEQVIVSADGGGQGQTVLKKGEHYPVEIRYHHTSGDARMKVSWSVSGKPEQLLKVSPSR